MSLFHRMHAFDGFQNGGVVFGHRELQPPPDGSPPEEGEPPPPNAVASTAMMVVLLLLIIFLAIFFCCMSSREMNEVRTQRQRSRHRSSINLIDGMTKKERAEYVKNALQTKKYEKAKGIDSDVESGAEGNDVTKDDTDEPTAPDAPVKGHDDDDDDPYSHDQCAICLLDYVEGDEISWSHNKQCTHLFHSDCLFKWLMKHEECPYCRRPYLIDNSDGSTDAGTDVEAGPGGDAAAASSPPEPQRASSFEISPYSVIQVLHGGSS